MAEIRGMLAQLIQGNKSMTTTLDALTSEVANNTSVEQSAVTLLGNLKTALDAAGTDPVALKALSDQLATNDAALASAITANTPAATTTSGGTSTVTGGNGTDTLTGGNGTDTVSGGNGTDTTSGGTTHV
jgi:Ca2+-binding RTX toxin-like protein